ncbi:MAG: hypothetical protein AAF718_17710 [Pseudomonadota bacterium]
MSPLAKWLITLALLIIVGLGIAVLAQLKSLQSSSLGAVYVT